LPQGARNHPWNVAIGFKKIGYAGRPVCAGEGDDAVMKSACVFILAMLWPLAAAAQAEAPHSWDDILAAARKEGKVVVLGPASAELRRTLPAAFKDRFGITMEYLGGRTGDQIVKLRAERQAGIYSADAVLSGIDSFSGVFYPEKLIAPLRPVLVLPEVVDGSKWKKGKLWFSDPDDQYVLRLANNVSNMFHVNTSQVKLEELRSAQDLLNPKWKGRIALEDPVAVGSGSNHAAHFYIQLGGDFIKKLYIDQKPMISRDKRALMDALAHGTYPIALGADDQDVVKMRSEGMPLTLLQGFSDLDTEISGGSGLLGILSDPPHPNAARVFVNWIASKEGSDVYARARGAVPTRNDIDESFLPPEVIPRQGVKYFDNQDWNYTVVQKAEARRQVNKIMQEAR
jgi:ABC-type Fe3+ transport system substrate-binding protein